MEVSSFNMLFFAYGSMMNIAEIEKRGIRPLFETLAKLPNHSLRFTRFSKNRSCGVADAVESQSEDVWGVVYSLTEEELSILDRFEGFEPGRALDRNSYIRYERLVYRLGESNQPLQVQLYLANRQSNPPKPSAEYKELLVSGAKAYGLPQFYQAMLMSIETEACTETP